MVTITYRRSTFTLTALTSSARGVDPAWRPLHGGKDPRRPLTVDGGVLAGAVCPPLVVAGGGAVADAVTHPYADGTRQGRQPG